VRTTPDPAKSVTLHQRMIWYDNVYYPPKKGIQFPAGRYELEAEDADYWYLRSTAPLELWDLDHGRVAEVTAITGGLMFAKRFMSVPAAGYRDGAATDKVLIWEVGSDFRSMEGKYWTKNF
jgi:hypothetical protein